MTVLTDPMSAPANPEVQAVLDAHIVNVGSEHFPVGFFPIRYTLTLQDAESFPQLPPLREPLEAALFGKWDQLGSPYLVCQIDATRVHFALTRGVLSRFCCAVMGWYRATLGVELKLSEVTLEGLSRTLKLCTAEASKEFVSVLQLQQMPPQGLDPKEQWLWPDPVKKRGWTHRTAADVVVLYQTVKVQAWDAVAPTKFSTNRRLRTHIPDITHPTLYTTNTPFTMLGMGCPHPSFHNCYPVANHDIPHPPSSRMRVLPRRATASMTTSSLRICGSDWRSSPQWNSAPQCSRRWTSRPPGKVGGAIRRRSPASPTGSRTTSGRQFWPCWGSPSLRWRDLRPCAPRSSSGGFQIPHRNFALSVKQSLQCMVVFIRLTTSRLSKSLQVCLGTQGGYHAANRWDIVIEPISSVTPLRGTVIQRGAGGPGRALLIPFAPAGYRSRMLTVEPESLTELMNGVPVMPSERLAEGAAVGSPLGTVDSLNFSPLDQGSEESAPAEAVPATNRWGACPSSTECGTGGQLRACPPRGGHAAGAGGYGGEAGRAG